MITYSIESLFSSIFLFFILKDTVFSLFFLQKNITIELNSLPIENKSSYFSVKKYDLK